MFKWKIRECRTEVYTKNATHPQCKGLSTTAVSRDARFFKKLHPPTTPSGFKNIFNHNALCHVKETEHGIIQSPTCFLWKAAVWCTPGQTLTIGTVPVYSITKTHTTLIWLYWCRDVRCEGGGVCLFVPPKNNLGAVKPGVFFKVGKYFFFTQWNNLLFHWGSKNKSAKICQ
jgi:hypothetical protein